MARLRKGLDEFLERDQARALFDLAPGEQQLSGGYAPPVGPSGSPWAITAPVSEDRSGGYAFSPKRTLS